tara:strand:- start:21220 stop:21867 length:648 start_codon:yes stop_codon:yes gene_type:complete
MFYGPTVYIMLIRNLAIDSKHRTSRKAFVKPITLLSFTFYLTIMGCMELVRRPNTPTITQTDIQIPKTSKKPRSLEKEVPSSKGDSSNLSDEERNRIGKINSYALWCIDNNMWKEARSHIQRGLEIDSLSASLHNNMAIIYEQAGKIDSAQWHYQRALSLKPDETPYKSNLLRMKSREQARVDTSKKFDLFERELPSRRRSQYRDPMNQNPMIGD